MGEPFPDGVVNADFIFEGGYLEYLCYEAVKCMVDKHKLKPNLLKLFKTISEKPITLSDGTTVIKNTGNNDGHVVIDGNEILIFRSHPPYAVFQKDKEMIIVGYEPPPSVKEVGKRWVKYLGSRLTVHYCRDAVNDFDASENHIEFRDQSFYGNGFSALAKRDFRMDGSDAYAFMRLTVCLDDMFNKPRSRKRIEALTIDHKITEVGAEYLRRMKACPALIMLLWGMPIFILNWKINSLRLFITTPIWRQPVMRKLWFV
jgi:hypothetical protein